MSVIYRKVHQTTTKLHYKSLSIETFMFYRNAPNYHLIDVMTFTDARRGHMLFLTKLIDHGFSNLSDNELH